MCGICGVIGIDDARESEVLVRRMMGAMVHRGPDGEGLLAGQGAAMGMRRLSIIDLPGGNQPIWNENRTRVVVFNGEIYNYRELRGRLEGLGHQFHTQSDTEVIVHAYEAWGSDCVGHLRGMFSFAVAELPNGDTSPVKKVFLARDRMGIKPLYYAVVDDVFFFASEVRALVASGAIQTSLSSSALSSYLLFGSVSEPVTLLAGVKSLPPGSCMTVDVQKPVNSAEPKCYWAPASGSLGANRSTSAGHPTRLRALLEESVRVHMIADVPLGVFLSSGIDSTALAALARLQRDDLHTFTLIFPEAQFSEAELSRQTAKDLGTVHAEVALSGEEMLARIGEAIDAFDQPSMDGINTYFVSWGARQAGLKVALSGLGSDELFGGYSTFQAAQKLRNIQKLAQKAPAFLRQAATPAVEFLSASLLASDAAKKASSAWSNPEFFDHTYFYTRTVFPPSQIESLAAADLFSKPMEWEEWLAQVSAQAEKFNAMSQISWLELRTYMLSTLLRDSDAMSMASSLEIRVPFLDHVLVEFVLSLDDSDKFKARPKALLIEALKDILPMEVVNQRKRTFTLPWEVWLKGALRDHIESRLANWSPHLEAHLPQRNAERVLRDFLAGKTGWARVWSLYVLNEWVTRHITSFVHQQPTGTSQVYG
jgi:asparagine synthase (glutamine-hydrolysing)